MEEGEFVWGESLLAETASLRAKGATLAWIGW